jgi:hypothetical protein
MKLRVIESLALVSLLFTGCATRDQLSVVPTPTPGEMDVAYATPVNVDSQSSIPAPPDTAPVATPTEQPTMPAPPPEPVQEVQESMPTETPIPVYSRKSYIVQKGDSLWNISGKIIVMGDRFRWPLLFKANRASIVDPDLIKPGLDLTWKANYSMSEVEDAIDKAKDTPAYVPHMIARKELPVEY